jgi:hypothetical protein
MQRVRIHRGTWCIRLRALSAVMLIAGLQACASLWQPVQGRIDSSRWSIEAPPGWMRLVAPDFEMLSRDGPYLQYIFIQERSLAQEFKHTGQRFEPDMLPHELARIVIDNLENDKRVKGFKLLENKPVQVGGLSGFKLVYVHRDQQAGADLKTIYYGAKNGDTYFNLRYTAAQRHYYEAGLNAFEQSFQSLRLSSDP